MMKNLIKLFLLMSVTTLLTTTASAQSIIIQSSIVPNLQYSGNDTVGYQAYSSWVGLSGKCSDNTIVAVTVREYCTCPAGIVVSAATSNGSSSIDSYATDYSIATGNVYISYTYSSICDSNEIFGNVTYGSC
jgi:hypothetical protein